MYIITLTLTDLKTKAPDFMAEHNSWIKQGVADGVFVLVGSLIPQGGGAILALSPDADSLSARIAADPFVREGIVQAHIQAIEPAVTDPRLSFLQSTAE